MVAGSQRSAALPHFSISIFDLRCNSSASHTSARPAHNSFLSLTSAKTGGYTPSVLSQTVDCKLSTASCLSAPSVFSVVNIPSSALPDPRRNLSNPLTTNRLPATPFFPTLARLQSNLFVYKSLRTTGDGVPPGPTNSSHPLICLFYLFPDSPLTTRHSPLSPSAPLQLSAADYQLRTADCLFPLPQIAHVSNRKFRCFHNPAIPPLNRKMEGLCQRTQTGWRGSG